MRNNIDINASNIRKIIVHNTIVKYDDATGGGIGTIPFAVKERTHNIDLVNSAGWYEIVAGPAAGKTTLAFLMAKTAMQENRQAYYFDFRLSHESPTLPNDFSERGLLLLDNVHLSDELDIHQLFHQLQKDVLVVAFSRGETGSVSRYLSRECKRQDLDDSEIQEYLSTAVVDVENFTSEEQILFEKCISEVSDWEQARWLRHEFELDIKKTLKEYSTKSSINEYLSFLIRKRLEQDNLLDNEVLIDIAAFTFIDLKILPVERDRTDENFEIEFKTLQRQGWLSRDRDQLSHPRLAEQILRIRGELTNKEEGGERLGRRLAKLLIRGNATEVRLLQVVRNIRYGHLPQVPKLLLNGLYPKLLQAPQQTIPINPVLIHFGSDLRRKGEITEAVRYFLLVLKSDRNALWRYEYAFIPFMEGTVKSLKYAEKILFPDLTNKNDKDRLINGGLYALVLSRQGRLEEADRILKELIDSPSSVSANLDAKRWRRNAAIHYCETGVGLVVHRKLKMTELEKRYAMVDNFSHEPAFKGGRAFIESLYATLKEDWNSCWEAINIVIAENREREYVQQLGVYLALKALAAPFIGKSEKERILLNEILAFPQMFDNRRAQLWARIRIKEIGSPADPRLLIRMLYPDVSKKKEEADLDQQMGLKTPAPASAPYYLNILHFSDLHFGELSLRADEKYKGSFDNFITWMKNHLEFSIKKNNIDLLIISGDLGSKGKIPLDPYLLEFLEIFKDSKVPIIICNGNHDLERLRIDEGKQFDQFNNFIDNIKNYLGTEPYDDKYIYGFSKQFAINQVSYILFPQEDVLFLSLNSCRAIENGNEDVGVLQIRDINNIFDEIEKCYENYLTTETLRILVCHHTIEQLKDSPIIMNCLKENNIEIILSGHYHDSNIFKYRDIVNFVAGSIFQEPKGRSLPDFIVPKLQFNRYIFDIKNRTVSAYKNYYDDDAHWKESLIE